MDHGACLLIVQVSYVSRRLKWQSFWNRNIWLHLYVAKQNVFSVLGVDLFIVYPYFRALTIPTIFKLRLWIFLTFQKRQKVVCIIFRLDGVL
jgi:hypothetical protein